MQVRCPFCRTSTSVQHESSIHDICCESCGSSFSLLPAETIDAPPPELKTLDEFELGEVLGSGAFGTVWKAFDSSLQRNVAIKVPRKENLSEAESERFIREAQAAAQLKHPNIVGVHEVGRDDGTLYIVSDFVDGITLADWLTGKRLSIRESVALIKKLAIALDYAHRSGVVHRDLKPANILLSDELEPHILDFGMARRDLTDVTMTMDGQVMGTPAYMAPEQARGEGNQADGRADVYALGVILYELLTGETPFRGNPRMLLHQVLNDDAPSPRKLDGLIPKDVETIALKCLEKEPKARFQSAKELADELERFESNIPIKSRPIGLAGQTLRWGQRNRGLAAAISTAVICLIAGTCTSTVLWLLAANAADEERLARESTTAALKLAQDAEEESRLAAKAESEARTAADFARDKAQRTAEQLSVALADARKAQEAARSEKYAAEMQLIDEAWDKPDIQQVRSLLYRHIPAEGETDYRRWEWYHWYEKAHPKHRAIEFNDTIAICEFVPDSNVCAVATYRGEVWLIDARSGKPLYLSQSSTLKPQRILVANDLSVIVRAEQNGETISYLFDSKDPAQMMTESGFQFWLRRPWMTLTSCIAPNGKSVVIYGKDKKLHLVDLVEKQEGVTSAEVEGVIDCTVSADNRHLLCLTPKQVVCLNLADLRERWTKALPGDDPKATKIKRGANGRFLVTTAEGIHAFLHSADGPESVDLIARKAVTNFHLRRNDQEIVYRSGTTTRAGAIDDEKNVMSRELINSSVFLRSRFTLKNSYSSDGEWVAATSLSKLSTDNRVVIFPLNDTDTKSALEAPPSTFPTFSVSDDESVILFCNQKALPAQLFIRGQRKFLNNQKTNDAKHCDLTRDGRLAAIAYDDANVVIWNTATQSIENTIDLPEGVEPYAAIFSPDGKHIAVVGTYGFARVYSSDTFQSIAEIGEPEVNFGFATVDYSEDGKWLATGGYDEQVRIFKRTAGGGYESYHTLSDQLGDIIALSFSPDAKLIAAGDDDRNAVCVWEVETGRLLGQHLDHAASVRGIAFSPDSQTLASSGEDRTLYLRDPKSGKVRSVFSFAYPLRGAQFLKSGDLLFGRYNSRESSLMRLTSRVIKSFTSEETIDIAWSLYYESAAKDRTTSLILPLLDAGYLGQNHSSTLISRLKLAILNQNLQLTGRDHNKSSQMVERLGNQIVEATDRDQCLQAIQLLQKSTVEPRWRHEWEVAFQRLELATKIAKAGISRHPQDTVLIGQELRTLDQLVIDYTEAGKTELARKTNDRLYESAASRGDYLSDRERMRWLFVSDNRMIAEINARNVDAKHATELLINRINLWNPPVRQRAARLGYFAKRFLSDDDSLTEVVVGLSKELLATIKSLPEDSPDLLYCAGAGNDLAWTVVAQERAQSESLPKLFEAARELASTVVDMTEESAFLDTLAVCHGRMGDFENAIKFGEKAIELALEDAPDQKEELIVRLEGFREGEPLRMPTPDSGDE